MMKEVSGQWSGGKSVKEAAVGAMTGHGAGGQRMETTHLEIPIGAGVPFKRQVMKRRERQ